jgi:hypothetical protein
VDNGSVPTESERTSPDPKPPPGTNRGPGRGGRRRSKDEARRRAAKDREAKREDLERQVKALSPAKKRDLVRVNRFVVGFGLLALVAMIALTMPLPWPGPGLAALIVAVAVAVRGIRLARRTPLGNGAVMYLSLGLALLGMFTVYSIPMVTTWEEQWDYQQCLSQTQTIEGQDACRAAYEKATADDWSRVLQPSRK